MRGLTLCFQKNKIKEVGQLNYFFTEVAGHPEVKAKATAMVKENCYAGKEDR